MESKSYEVGLTGFMRTCLDTWKTYAHLLYHTFVAVAHQRRCTRFLVHTAQTMCHRLIVLIKESWGSEHLSVCQSILIQHSTRCLHRVLRKEKEEGSPDWKEG